ncbi:hypothetical protein DL93DRAFT_1781456 [Clavulina sp. PMI_390]|nr:hypothetical protein DL93DRAFT_1781456 [Clavulina sp. PMI_390]
MHRALQIPEVVDYIFQSADKEDLPICAVLCRAWELPALRVLWKAPADLTPLFRLLGPLSESYEKTIHRSSGVPVEPERWERFQRYSKLIRVLDISIGGQNGPIQDPDKPVPVVSPATFQEVALIAASTGQPLFPSLTSLNVWLLSKESATAASSLFLPRLSRVQLTWTSDSELGLPWLASRLWNQAESMRMLALDFIATPTNPGVGVCNHLTRAVASFQGLTELDIPCFLAKYTPAWNVIASLPKLEWFGIHNRMGFAIKGAEPEDQGGLCSFNGGFQSITHLVGEGAPDLALTLFQRSSPLPTLRSLQFRTQEPMSNNKEFSLLLEAIVALAPNLEELCLTIEAPDDFTVEDFEALTKLKSLRGLWIRLERMLPWTDEEYRSFASTMPRLTRLYLAMDPSYCPSHPESTLLALSYITSTCPDLKELGIFVNALAPAFPGHDTTFEPLPPDITINFGFSLISDPLLVAMELYRMCGQNHILVTAGSGYAFPLANIEARDQEFTDTYAERLNYWDDVREMLERLQPLVATLLRPLAIPLQQLDAHAKNGAPLHEASENIESLLSVLHGPGALGSILRQ